MIVIHGNKVDNVPKSYQRYLEKGFRKYLKLEGTPIRVEFRGGANPYAERKSNQPNRQPANKKQFSDLSKRQKRQRKGKKV